MSKLSDLLTTTAVVDAGDTSGPMSEAAIQEKMKQLKALVKTGEIKLSDYRAAFKAALDDDTTLSDNQILYCVATIDDDDMDAVVLAMKELQDAQGGVAAGDEPDARDVQKETQQQSVSLADKLANDTEFKASMEKILVAKETLASGPIAVLLHLERIWNNDDWGTVPMPGSTKYNGKEHRDTDVDGNTPHDLTDAKEGNRKIVISWFKETIRTVNPALFESLADVQNVMKKLEERDLSNAQRKEWNGLSILKKMALEKKFTDRISAYRTQIEKAVRVRFMRDAIATITNKEGKAMIGVDFDWDGPEGKKKKVLASTASPILIYDNTVQALTEKVCDPMTVTTFLKLGVDTVIAMQSDEYTPTFADLMQTLARDKEAIKAAKLAAKFAIDNVNEMEISFATLASWFDEKVNLDAFKVYRSKLNDKADPEKPVLMTEREQFEWMLGEAIAKMQLNLVPLVMPRYRVLKDAVDVGTKIHPMDAVDAEHAAQQSEQQRKAS